MADGTCVPCGVGANTAAWQGDAAPPFDPLRAAAAPQDSASVCLVLNCAAAGAYRRRRSPGPLGTRTDAEPRAATGDLARPQQTLARLPPRRSLTALPAGPPARPSTPQQLV